MVNSMPVRAAALLASVFAISAAAQTYTVKTFAGGGLPQNVAGPSASLSAISGMAIDPAGNMYLALGDYHIVLRLDANTAVLTGVAGTGTAGFGGDNGPATSALLNNPTAVAVDGAGNLYIADAGNSRIRIVSAAGIIATFAGNGTAGFGGDNGPATAAQFNGPADLAIAPSGDLYVADFYNQAVRKISGGGYRITLKTPFGATVHSVGIPTQRDITLYRRTVMSATDLPHGQEELRYRMEPAVALYDSVASKIERYAASFMPADVPPHHKSAVVVELVQAIDELDPALDPNS